MRPPFCLTWSRQWDQPDIVEFEQCVALSVPDGWILGVAVPKAEGETEIAATLASTWKWQEDVMAGCSAGGGGGAVEVEAFGELPVGDCGGGRDGRKGGGLGRQLAAAGEK